MNMPEKIRLYIKNRGMTLTFVANKAGIDRKKFYRLINGKQDMSLDNYEKICSALDVKQSFFYNHDFLDSKNISA